MDRNDEGEWRTWLRKNFVKNARRRLHEGRNLASLMNHFAGLVRRQNILDRFEVKIFCRLDQVVHRIVHLLVFFFPVSRLPAPRHDVYRHAVFFRHVLGAVRRSDRLEVNENVGKEAPLHRKRPSCAERKRRLYQKPFAARGTYRSSAEHHPPCTTEWLSYSTMSPGRVVTLRALPSCPYTSSGHGSSTSCATFTIAEVTNGSRSTCGARTAPSVYVRIP
mmetsp:Transcript_17948/g.40758  ORF Transcript_17948/g.40758 Transcript_17948/m.40758 type:complete len:220 (-) Transcript_17948:119-778(-)